MNITGIQYRIRERHQSEAKVKQKYILKRSTFNLKYSTLQIVFPRQNAQIKSFTTLCIFLNDRERTVIQIFYSRNCLADKS